jgi:AcrR family transcriptional regulator
MKTTPEAGAAAHSYHHGDLRRALLDAAVAAIAEAGAAALSLRDLARRAGVSHAAPAHHFGDKAGLLTAVAVEGYRRLGAALRAAYQDTGSFLEVGVAYVRFALDNRPYFEVMYRPELYHAGDPELVAARQASAALLYGPAGDVSLTGVGAERLAAGVAAWSLMHGLITLWLAGNLPPQLGDDPEQIARTVAAYLSRPASPQANRPPL